MFFLRVLNVRQLGAGGAIFDGRNFLVALECGDGFLDSIVSIMQNALEDSPPIVREADERLVRLTPPAGEKAVRLIERDGSGPYLRLAISGGGCNGLSYKMKFVGALKKGDILVRSAGVQVVVDSKSALYLKGTVLDYSDRMVAGGFKFSNPNAKASCSCGESFSI